MDEGADTARRIDFIKDLNFREVEIDLLKDLISELMQGYTTITQELAASPIYRARRFYSHNSIKNISDLWYPSKKK